MLAELASNLEYAIWLGTIREFAWIVVLTLVALRLIVGFFRA
jgi:hypothetical protein